MLQTGFGPRAGLRAEFGPRAGLHAGFGPRAGLHAGFGSRAGLHAGIGPGLSSGFRRRIESNKRAPTGLTRKGFRKPNQ